MDIRDLDAQIAALEAELARRDELARPSTPFSEKVAKEAAEFVGSFGAGATSAYSDPLAAAMDLGTMQEEAAGLRQQFARPEGMFDRAAFDFGAGVSSTAPFAAVAPPQVRVPMMAAGGASNVVGGMLTDQFGPAGLLLQVLGGGGTQAVQNYLNKRKAFGQISKQEQDPLTAEQTKEAEKLTEMGVPTTRSDLTGDIRDRAREGQAASESPGAFQTFLNTRIQQAQGILQGIEKALGVGDVKQVNPVFAVNNLAKGYQLKVKQTVEDFKRKASEMYNKIPDSQIKADSLIEDLASIKSRSLGNERIDSFITGYYDKFAKQLSEDGTISVKTLWNMKKELNDAVYKGVGDPDSPFFGMDLNQIQGIQRRIMGSMYKIVDDAAAAGNKSALELQKANKFYRDGMAQIDIMRAAPLQKIFGDNFEALLANDPDALLAAVNKLGKKEVRLLSTQFKQAYPQQFEVIRRAAFNDAMQPFMTQVQSGNKTFTILDTNNLTTKQLEDAFEKYPFLTDGQGKGSAAAKRLSRFFEVTNKLFKGSGKNAVDRSPDFQQQGANILADLLGASSQERGVQMRYLFMSVGKGLNLQSTMAKTPEIVALMATNPRYQEAFIRITKRMAKDKDGRLTPSKTKDEDFTFSPEIEKDVKTLVEMIENVQIGTVTGLLPTLGRTAAAEAPMPEGGFTPDMLEGMSPEQLDSYISQLEQMLETEDSITEGIMP